MKKEGKTAAQINAAWEEETGRRPAAEYIARRWPKLRAVAVKLSDDDVSSHLIRFRDLRMCSNLFSRFGPC